MVLDADVRKAAPLRTHRSTASVVYVSFVADRIGGP
jgi:hypothetical protein